MTHIMALAAINCAHVLLQTLQTVMIHLVFVLPNWTRENCTVDVDECITNSNSCNFTTQECINNVGGFSCVCLYGNSSTGCIGTVY